MSKEKEKITVVKDMKDLRVLTTSATGRLVGMPADQLESYTKAQEERKRLLEQQSKEDANDNEEKENKNWRFCVVGNIVRSHKGSDGETYYGTKEFTGGTKVYIDGKNWFNFERTDIAVIGLNRFKKYAIESVDPQLIENVRFQVIHKPVVLQILDYEECIEGWSWWGRTAQDKREAKEFAENWEDLLETVRKRNRPD